MTDMQLLRDPNIQPEAEVLEAALGERKKVYDEFTSRTAEQGIVLEWRYYNDGKSWLGKGTHKKKTVFWLSIWEEYFQVSLFFTEKTLPATESVTGTIGKLIPVVTKVRSEAELERLFGLVGYKKNLK